jgi:superfamily II DNA or RNA helicase
MQIPQSSNGKPAIRPGDLVLVRRARWRIVGVRAYEDCRLVTLRGVAAPYRGVERRVLLPFDTIDPIARRPGPRRVRAGSWRRACRALIAADGPPGALQTARDARIDLLPHQLEPAIAILRGLGTRVLLADAVGLGKTIQAGLVVSELLARGSIERVLVLTPPGLRDQWVQEIADRFGIHAPAADAATLRRLASTLPIGVNPWRTLSIAVASVDYVKRPEVFPAAASCRWDLVIVDEAHACGEDSDRRASVHALAARAAYVMLLSATPHNGDREAFDALCGIGALAGDAPLLVFRRTRADAGIGVPRHIHIVAVRPADGEVAMQLALARYRDAVRADAGNRDASLALAVLHKRAWSSAWSLAQSVERRLAALDAGDRVEQLTLPLGDPQGELIAADQAPDWPSGLRLSDPARERRLLTVLHRRALAAALDESKIEALARILRRARQPAVVFTEYRDTLRHVQDTLARPALLLHGGLTREERSTVLAAFARDPRGLLLATDAAAEGLNLHHHCRLVINLELPWNPMRLEQRIGRVDRIGQRHAVHAFHLVARGTAETRLLTHLRERVAAAQDEIGAPDPLGDDRTVARLVMEIDGDVDDPDAGESAS